MALMRNVLGGLGFWSILLLWAAPALAQDAGVDASVDAGVDASVDASVDGGPDPCLDACGPDLLCIQLGPDWFCGQCAPDETRDCESCPGATQTCGADLYWEPCECPGCGDGPACGPGLECIEVDGFFYCGICAPGDARDCNNGCGPGVETCEGDLFWGRCVPTDPVECVPGDRETCTSECGPGHMECDAASCNWTGQCVPDALIQCLPNTTTTCIVIGACQGTQLCSDTCSWGTCEPPEGGCHVCGDGVIDDGEDCDDGNLFDGDDCSSECHWENARPFQSCDCHLAPGLPMREGAALALLVGLFGLILRRRMR